MSTLKFEMPPFKTRSWITLDRAVELTSQSPAAIQAAINSGRVSWKAVLEGDTQYSLVDRSQILAYFHPLTPAS